MTDNKKGLIILETKYGTICMYGGIITNLNPLTFHHCFVLKRDGGHASEFNGAVACRLEHSANHILSESSRAWDNRLKDYIREYKSYLKPNMSCEEFIALKVIQEMRLEIHKEMTDAVFDMGYEEFLSKDRIMQYRRSSNNGNYVKKKSKEKTKRCYNWKNNTIESW